jgi:hypothetical protein
MTLNFYRRGRSAFLRGECISREATCAPPWQLPPHANVRSGIPAERFSIHTDSLWPRKFNTYRDDDDTSQMRFARRNLSPPVLNYERLLRRSAPRSLCMGVRIYLIFFLHTNGLLRKIVKTHTYSDGCAQLMAMKSASLVFTSREMKMLLVFAAANLQE